MEAKLGAAYAEPAGDVRGYIAHMKSQKPALTCPHSSPLPPAGEGIPFSC